MSIKRIWFIDDQAYPIDLGFLHARRMSTGEESQDHNIQIEGKQHCEYWSKEYPLGVKNDILNFWLMHEGKLHIRYFGVPLLSKRLTATDCDVLVSKIASRIDSWLARNLSFAGRLQLVSSVLLSMQVYWAKVFILPKRVIFLLQQKFNRFLWGGKDTKVHAKKDKYIFAN